MAPAQKSFCTGPDDAGRRLDRILFRILPDQTRTRIFAALRRGAIRVNTLRATAATRLQEGDTITIPESMMASGMPSPEAAVPEAARPHLDLHTDSDPVRDAGSKADLREIVRPALESLIMLRTEHLLFLDKPRGMLSHGKGSLEDLVLEDWCSRGRSATSLAFRPGPLHRLDRNTSGLITFPETLEGARVFSELLRSRGLRKFYLALLGGRLEESCSWEDRLERDRSRGVTSKAGGREGSLARTSVQPLMSRNGLTLACIEIHTGLTHQIRAQASLHGFPLAGDRKYGSPLPPLIAEGGYYLHAWALRFHASPFNDVPETLLAPPPGKDLTVLGTALNFDLKNPLVVDFPVF